MAMKGIFQKSILVVVWMVTVLLAGCDKEGKNGWLYSEGQDFRPISNLTEKVDMGMHCYVGTCLKKQIN